MDPVVSEWNHSLSISMLFNVVNYDRVVHYDGVVHYMTECHGWINTSKILCSSPTYHIAWLKNLLCYMLI